jgi:Protein of unknown function (DUF1236)
MEHPMNSSLLPVLAALSLFSSAQLAFAQSDDLRVPQNLELTAAQRNAIYTAVVKDRSKESPQEFSTALGADVPPMIELYALPDDAVAGNPDASFFKYTTVENEVVLVDPTKMRAIGRIGPSLQP